MSSQQSPGPSRRSQGRGKVAVATGITPVKRRRVPTPEPVPQDPEYEDQMSIDTDAVDDNNQDSGGSVYRSNEYAYFLSCAPLLHNHRPMIILNIDLEAYDPVFTSMYNAFHRTCYAAASTFMPITLANFIRVARLCLKARIDFVYMRLTGARALDRVNQNQAPEMPRCLAEIVNGIGFVSAWNTYATICPHAQQEREEANMRANRTPALVVGQFNLLVTNLVKKGYTTRVPLSRTEDGTRYYLMQVRDIVVAQPATAQGNAEIVNCRTQIDNTTPADITLAAIVQNGFDGQIPNLGFTVYESDPIAGVSAIRSKFYVSR